MSDQLQRSSLLPWIEMKRPDVSVESLTKLLDDWTADCDFAMDGLVVSEDRMSSGNPKYSIAFKKETGTETAISTVTSVHPSDPSCHPSSQTVVLRAQTQ